MSQAFGKSFSRWYYPLVDDTLPEGLLTAQAPAIHIFTTQPSRGQAQSGSGSFQTVTAWDWDSARNGWIYTVAVIDDPDPASSQDTRVYWEAINFRLQSAAQIQTDIRSLEMSRVSGQSFAVGVTDEMLRQYYPQLDSCSNSTQRYHQTILAIEDVKSRLKAKGYEWARVARPDRLTIAVAYRVLYMIMLVQIQAGNDKYAIKYAEFKAIFDATIDSLSLEYDSNNDGLPDTQINASVGTAFLIR